MQKNKLTAKVLFLLDIMDNDVFAFFPELVEGKHSRLCYDHIGQHSECSIDYAKECKTANDYQYLPLINELNNIGYELIILNKN